MPELVVLEFDQVDETQYQRVNAELGIDTTTGEGDWPPGLITHIGATVEDGRLLVVEIWESRDAQAEFMSTRLGAAVAAGGISSVPTVTWAALIGQKTPAAG